MDDEEFWALIDAAKAASAGDLHRQAVLLQAELDRLPLPEVVGFQRRLEAIDAESFRVDLWGAAEVIEERISEDAFFGFRGWLVAQGRAVFEAVVADPDALADARAACGRAAGHRRDLGGSAGGLPGPHRRGAARGGLGVLQACRHLVAVGGTCGAAAPPLPTALDALSPSTSVP